MSLLDLIPSPYRIAAVATLLAAFAGIAGMQTLRLSWLQAEVTQAKAKEAERYGELLLKARRDQDAITITARKAADAYLADAQQARATAAGIGLDHQRMLDALHAAGGTAEDPAAACRTDAERARVLSRLVEEGAGLLRESADRVGVLDAKLAGLQGQSRIGIDALKLPDPTGH